MIIAIDYNAALRQIAGIGRYTRELVYSLLLEDPGDEVVLFYAARDLDRQGWGMAGLAQLWQQFPTIRLVPLPFTERILTILWQRARVPLPIERWTGPVDIVHAPDFVLPPVHNAATVVTVHDLTFRVHPETAHPRLRRYLEGAVPQSLKRATTIIAVSQSTATDLQRLMGIEPGKITVIPHGISAHFRRVMEAEQLERVRDHYALHAPFFLHVGTIEPRKNLLRLIEAFRELHMPLGQPAPELVLVGRTGWLAEPILAAVQTTPGVRLLGPIPDVDLPVLYSLATAVAYPSLYEGFGFPALEALACGTPVIVANASSLPEVVGELGLLVEPYDTVAIRHAMERVLSEPGVTSTARMQGPAHVAHFTWERAAQQLLAVYRGTLEHKA
ncbi:MAG: glycosyltransferase family 4 protein [Herpetosiphonaceae bacterium]|nr:glycosyltransferase family 4 protein [Herpetosiphonaceae bacterium]